MIPIDLHFEAPSAFWLLLFLPVFILCFWFVYRERERQRHHLGLVTETMVQRSPPIFKLKCLAFLLAWIALVFALAQPIGNTHYPEAALLKMAEKEAMRHPVPRRLPQDVILLVDTSRSMSVPDMPNGMTRLEAAKDVAEQLLSQLKGPYVSLYAFTSEVVPLSPPTLDDLFVRLQLRHLSIDEGETGGGTNLRRALEDMALLLSSKSPLQSSFLILFSDGGDTEIEALTGDQRQQAIHSLLNAFPPFLDSNLKLLVVGMGTREGRDIPQVTHLGKPVRSSLQEDLLRQLALKGKGFYFEANDFSRYELANQIAGHILRDQRIETPQETFRREESKGQYVIYDLYFYIPLGVAILLLSYILLWPNVGFDGHRQSMLYLLMLFLPSVACAERGIMQTAIDYVEAKQYKNALEVYEEVLRDEQLNPQQRATVLYNRGTVLLAMQRYGEAAEQLAAISLEEVSPLLARRARANLALALIMEAKTASLDPLSAVDRSESLVSEALTEIEEAHKADCQLQQAEGATHCRDSQDLVDLERFAREVLAELLVKHPSSQREYEPLEDTPTSLEAGIQHLLNHYRRISRQQPLREDSLSSLLSRQQQIENLVQEPLKESYRQSERDLERSLDNARQDRHRMARFFFEKARYPLRSLLRTFSPQEERSSKAILANAIEDQQHALLLNRLRLNTKRESLGEDPLLNLVVQAQRQAIKTAEPYLSLVLKEQSERFHDLQIPWNQRCQAVPWDQVLPLFDRGYQAAQEVASVGDLSLPLQKKAVEFWLEAMRRLEQPPTGAPVPGCPGQQESKENQEVLRNLQEMDQEDQLPKAKASSAPKVDKPW
jgi:Ca-activated chloride channel family protein